MININAHYAKNIFNKCMVLLFYFQYGILNFYQYWIAQRDEEDQPSITVTSHCHCTNKCPKLISVSVNNLSVWNSLYSSSSVIIEFCYSHLKSAVASSSLVPPKPPLSSSAAAAAATCLLWSQLISSTYCSLHLKSVEHALKKIIDHVVPYLINQEVFSVFKYTCICCIADNKGSLASVETVLFWM